MTAWTDDAETRLPTKVGRGVTNFVSVLPSRAVCGTCTDALAVVSTNREPPKLDGGPGAGQGPDFHQVSAAEAGGSGGFIHC